MQKDAASQAAPPHITLVICTFHREKLLEAAIASIMAQHPARARFDIIVVDNSDAETARPVVARASVGSTFPLRYLAAHPANISVARNAGVTAAWDADIIAFLDDDQTLAPDWLQAITEAVADAQVSVWFGAIDARFEALHMTTPFVRDLYSRHLPMASGERLFAYGPRKTPGIALSTGNSAFRRAALPSKTPFDPYYGAGGGEDFDLICRMQKNGAQFAWAPQARSDEFQPASRCTPDYLRARFFAGGQAFAKVVSNVAAHPARARWALRAKALAQIAILAAQWPMKLVAGEADRRDHSYVMAGALGKLSTSGLKAIYERKQQH